MILKPCTWGGCNALTDRKDGHCLKHARLKRNEAMRNYPTSTARGYGKEWREIRKMKLAMQPFCEHCQEAGRTTLATLVHHVDRVVSNTRPSNLQSLCVRCHQIEHRGDVFRVKGGEGDEGEGEGRIYETDR